jgi:hypothetical protein
MPVDYFSMNPQFQIASNPEATLPRSARPYVDIPKPPPLAINTLFRSQSQIPLPAKPPAYNYNYGFPAGKPNVSSLNGAVPLQGTPLTKIGREDFKPLAPVNIYPNIPLKC